MSIQEKIQEFNKTIVDEDINIVTYCKLLQQK
jgi:hypothetical protein